MTIPHYVPAAAPERDTYLRSSQHQVTAWIPAPFATAQADEHTTTANRVLDAVLTHVFRLVPTCGWDELPAYLDTNDSDVPPSDTWDSWNPDDYPFGYHSLPIRFGHTWTNEVHHTDVGDLVGVDESDPKLTAVDSVPSADSRMFIDDDNPTDPSAVYWDKGFEPHSFAFRVRADTPQHAQVAVRRIMSMAMTAAARQDYRVPELSGPARQGIPQPDGSPITVAITRSWPSIRACHDTDEAALDWITEFYRQLDRLDARRWTTQEALTHRWNSPESCQHPDPANPDAPWRTNDVVQFRFSADFTYVAAFADTPWSAVAAAPAGHRLSGLIQQGEAVQLVTTSSEPSLSAVCANLLLMFRDAVWAADRATAHLAGERPNV